MKHLFAIAFFVSCLLPLAKAEYGSTIFHFEATTHHNEVFEGYVQLSEYSFKADSLNSSDYLIQMLGRDQRMGGDSLWYHTELLKYTYGQPDTPGVDGLYSLFNPDTILQQELKRVRILNQYEQYIAIGIASKHTADDWEWMRYPVEREIHLEIDLCSYSFYLHEQTEASDDLITAVAALAELINTTIGLSESNPEDLPASAIARSQAAWDEQLSVLLEACEGHWIVVVAECTC